MVQLIINVETRRPDMQINSINNTHNTSFGTQIVRTKFAEKLLSKYQKRPDLESIFLLSSLRAAINDGQKRALKFTQNTENRKYINITLDNEKLGAVKEEDLSTTIYNIVKKNLHIPMNLNNQLYKLERMSNELTRQTKQLSGQFATAGKNANNVIKATIKSEVAKGYKAIEKRLVKDKKPKVNK